MSTLSPVYQAIEHRQTNPSLYFRFITWAAGQEKNRFMWLGLALFAHGCVLTPLTMFVVLITGSSFLFAMAALGAMALSLVVNLAALPAKITVPAFLASIVLDVVLIVASLL